METTNFKLNLVTCFTKFQTSLHCTQTFHPPPSRQTCNFSGKMEIPHSFITLFNYIFNLNFLTVRMTHQTSLTSSSVEVVDDRKALRDALYQGIFHRHRRTIFAVGSFLRMLKSRNSQYNTIRSSSEGEDDSAR